eukprot:5905825-Amphidinium_carterae.1
MEVDAENASSAAAASEIELSPAAAAAATSTSTLKTVVAVRGISREHKGSGSVTALPGGSVPKGDSEGNLGMKRKGKVEASSETVNPSGSVSPLSAAPACIIIEPRC